jgi:hypothetical protein
MKTTDWTPEEDGQLRSMVVAGLSSREVAATLRRSVAAVYARAHRLGLTFRMAGSSRPR